MRRRTRSAKRSTAMRISSLVLRSIQRWKAGCGSLSLPRASTPLSAMPIHHCRAVRWLHRWPSQLRWRRQNPWWKRCLPRPLHRKSSQHLLNWMCRQQHLRLHRRHSLQRSGHRRDPEPAPQPVAAADDLPPPAYTPRPAPQLTEAETFVCASRCRTKCGTRHANARSNGAPAGCRCPCAQTVRSAACGARHRNQPHQRRRNHGLGSTR